MPDTLYNGVPLLQKKVAVFRCPSDAGPETNQFYPHTNNQSGANFRYASNNYAPSQFLAAARPDTESPGTFKLIADGTSNTLLLAERRLNVQPREKRYSAGIVWGRTPATDAASAFHANWRINTPNPCDDYHAWNGVPGGNLCRAQTASSAHPGGAIFGLADGSVQFISETIATNPAGNACTGRNIIYTGPGFVYQNLYHPFDGNTIGSLD